VTWVSAVDLALDCSDALDPLSSTVMLPIRSAGEERSSALVNRQRPCGDASKSADTNIFHVKLVSDCH
jgi:hypothetical protein